MPELGPNCNPDQCDEAIAYLIAGFGPWYDDQEKRQLRRLFLDFTPREVTEAIDQLIKQWDRSGKPRAGDLGPILKANRRHLNRMAGHERAPSPEAPEPDLAREMVAAIKAGNTAEIERLTEEMTRREAMA